MSTPPYTAEDVTRRIGLLVVFGQRGVDGPFEYHADEQLSAMLTDLQRYREAWETIRDDAHDAANGCYPPDMVEGSGSLRRRGVLADLVIQRDRLIPPTEER